MTGIFITFEGIEGSGKTTQNQNLATYLKEKDHQIVQTREPGGTPFGTQIREWILDPAKRFQNPLTEVLLFYADRLEHISTVIQPALDQGKIVLCDRYVDSTWAYQVGGRQMPQSLISDLNKTISLIPNLTILLDISEEEGLARATKRAKLDRFEQEEIAFHRRVRQAYLDRAAQFPDRIIKINVENLSPDQVFEIIKQIIETKLERIQS